MHIRTVSAGHTDGLSLVSCSSYNKSNTRSGAPSNLRWEIMHSLNSSGLCSIQLQTAFLRGLASADCASRFMFTSSDDNSEIERQYFRDCNTNHDS